jgi:hypothetical protein
MRREPARRECGRRGVTGRRNPRNGFVRLPNDLFYLEQAGVVSWPELGLLTHLLFLVWRTEGSTTLTLRGFKDEFGWPWTPEFLRTSLIRLSSIGLLAVTSPGRGAGHNKWDVSIGSAWEFGANGMPKALTEEWLGSSRTAAFRKTARSRAGTPDKDTDTHADAHFLGVSPSRNDPYHYQDATKNGTPNPAAGVEQRSAADAELADHPALARFYDSDGGDSDQALSQLACDLADAEPATAGIFFDEFGSSVEVQDVRDVHEEILKRRTRGKPIKSETAFARSRIRNLVECREQRLYKR